MTSRLFQRKNTKLYRYKYLALDQSEKKHRGVFLSDNKQNLREDLARNKLFLVKSRKTRENSVLGLFNFSVKVKHKEISLFCSRLSAMLSAGLTIDKCVDLLKDESGSKKLKATLSLVSEDLKSGLLFSQSMAKYKTVFPAPLVSMARVGENSGGLDAPLKKMADFYEASCKIKTKSKKASVYPLALICLLAGVFAITFLYVIPAFKKSLDTLEVPLPAMTTAVLRLGNFISSYYLETLFCLAICIAIFTAALKSRTGKQVFHFVLSYLPLTGRVQRFAASAELSGALGILLSGGVDMALALDEAEGVIENTFFKKRVREAFRRVKGGESLSSALEHCGAFPPEFSHMVSVGENTGEYGKTLLGASLYFETRLQSELNTLTQLIQPSLLVITGGLVAVLFYAIYSPVIALINSLG
ncbi:MAG: type II secretion system F family protein [Eubacteriales bacterium]